MPKTTTITLRLNLVTILGCGDLLKQQNINPGSQPVSTTVRTVLESIIELMHRQGKIPSYAEDDTNLVTAYEDMFNQKLTTPNTSFDGLGELIKGKSVEDPIADIARQVDQMLSPEAESDIRRSTDEADTVDTPDDKIDLATLYGLPVEVMIKKAPKDKYVEMLQDPGVEEKVKAAIGIIYAVLDPKDWGTEKATAAIQDLLRQAK